MAAQKLGLDTLPTIDAAHLTEAQRRAYVLADNRTALDAGWDNDLLKIELQDLEAEGFDLSLTGFDIGEIAALTLDETEGLTDPDAVPDAPAVPVTVLGDVWLLGRHRLMCGDSTSIDAVERLMDGQKADMVFTDPPYGMDLNTDYSKLKGTEKSPNAKGYKWDKVIGDDQDFDPRQIMAMVDYCKEQFWWGADYYFECLPRGGSLVVWQKRDKADERMIGNDFEVCWSKQRHKKHTFWKRWVGFDSVERGEKRVHPTQKPIELIEWTMGKWAAAGGIVLDLFGGSGSTLIACEKTARDCRMMELDPKYCDLIITRWQNFAGQTATLEATGQPFRA
jgi:DNA modification methylase